MKMNWEKATENTGEFKLYPEGNYHVKINALKREKNKNSGNTQIKISATILDGEFKSEPITDFIVITEASQWRIAAFLAANLKLDVAQLPAMEVESAEFDALLNACKDRAMYWSVFVDTYNGKQVNKVTQRDPYVTDPNEAAVDYAQIEDVPEWVK
jgi:hypothetical protein